ncbi:hypothetical protein BDW22DRAFT_1482439 [Trametopsis cervina]|nr:hypothetical protein BDW22DRAFT_1482439 [Trametopsis cervina]
MMEPDVPSGVQSRISAFEALSTSKPAPQATKSTPNLLDTPNPLSKTYIPITPSSPSTSAANGSPRSSSTSSPDALGRETSLIDLKDWVLEDGPLPYAPRQKKVPGPNLRALGVNPLQRHVSDSVHLQGHLQPTPLIHLESSPPRSTVAAPPLPPRKTSYNSLKSVSASNSSSSSLSHLPSTSVPLPPAMTRKKSDSLTVDHTYPPANKLGIAIPSRGSGGSGHVPASSISSFHSVSLSSDGGTDMTTPGSLTNFVTTFPIDREDPSPDSLREHDTGSLDESFENVSASSMMSPTASSVSTDWAEYIRRPSEPPKLPQRPRPGPSAPSSPITSTPTIAVPYAVRAQSKGPPPPPPPRNRKPSSNRSSLASTTASSSDHSSVVSTGTSRSSLSSGRPIYQSKVAINPAFSPLARPPPIPPSAMRRYDVVFTNNVLAQRRLVMERERAMSPPPGRKARQAAGWRGLSVDLITNPEMAPMAPALEIIEERVDNDDRLDGRVVAFIWKTSRLERTKLQSIWKECDPAGRGSLDREAFVKGMWRVDEELRKAQMASRNKTAVRPLKGPSSILQ